MENLLGTYFPKKWLEMLHYFVNEHNKTQALIDQAQKLQKVQNAENVAFVKKRQSLHCRFEFHFKNGNLALILKKGWTQST
jgi:hypothetical protein